MQSVNESSRKRHAVQPSVCCCCCEEELGGALPAKGTSPKYSSTLLSVDVMLLSESETEDSEPDELAASPASEPALAGNCTSSSSSSVSVSMSRDRLLYTCRHTITLSVHNDYSHLSIFCLFPAVSCHRESPLYSHFIMNRC